LRLNPLSENLETGIVSELFRILERQYREYAVYYVTSPMGSWAAPVIKYINISAGHV